MKSHTDTYDAPDWFGDIDLEEQEPAQYFAPDGKPPEVAALESAHLADAYDDKIDALSRKIGILQERKRRAEAGKERARKWTKFLLDMAHMDKLNDGVVFISRRKAGQKLVVKDIAALPMEYLNVRTTPRLDDLNKHWKATGEILDGCDVEDTPETIIIRG